MSSVKVRDRNPSRFEVIDYFNETRRKFTDLLLRDFGYSEEKAKKRYQKAFEGKKYNELDEHGKSRWKEMEKKDKGFTTWFIDHERESFIRLFSDLNKELYIANSIYPIYREEVIERRTHMDNAIGICFSIISEMQYVGSCMPVNLNKYTRFSNMIEKESKLIKAWRASDNKQYKHLLNDEDLKNMGKHDISHNSEDITGNANITLESVCKDDKKSYKNNNKKSATDNNSKEERDENSNNENKDEDTTNIIQEENNVDKMNNESSK